MTDLPHTSEHTVPFFWPMAAAIEMQALGADALKTGLTYVVEAAKINEPPAPEWATPNKILLDLDTMRLRDFGGTGGGIPVIIDAPFAGHSSTIADYGPGQSLVAALLTAGLGRVLCCDWKSATPEMKNYDIDKYLAEINVVVDDLGGKAILVGLCQGGWMSSMYAARYPDKVAGLVLAGSPIDTDAGNGPIKKMAHTLPLSAYQEMVEQGGGRMSGKLMLTGWKNMHADTQYFTKYIDLYANITDRNYIERTERFESWYENPIDLPGVYYLQAIDQLFKRNLFAKGEFVGLGRTLKLGDITCPAFLMAGESDDITTREQVFAAEDLLGTPSDKIEKKLVKGGHIGLFMGSHTLKDAWPGIGAWLARQGAVA